MADAAWHRLRGRFRWAWAEIRREPIIRGAAAGCLVTIVALGAGVAAGTSVTGGLATGLLMWQVSAVGCALERRIRNAEDQRTVVELAGSSADPLLFGEWAVEADFGRILIEHVRAAPRTVVECGCGTSTILIASMLRQNGVGKLVSIEHDAAFATQTKARLETRNLADWVDIHVAPLARAAFDGHHIDWYDVTKLPQVAEIDLLVVDGPPPRQRFSRLPALEVFYDRLSPGASVLLDDGRRLNERCVATSWTKAHPDIELYWVDTLKGTWQLVRNPSPRLDGSIATVARALIRRLHPRPTGFGRSPVRR